VPEIFNEDIPLNHATMKLVDNFKVKQFETKEKPTPDQIAENKAKWGWTG